MADMDLPTTSDSSKTEKKYNNFVWWIAILMILGPSFFLAWNIVAQPPGNQTFIDLTRPDEGIGFDIQQAEINDGVLEMTVSYPGGCGDHKFDLYVEEQNSDINRQVDVYHTTEDTCDTKVIEDIEYDIQSVLDEHDSEQVVVTVIGNGQNPEPVLFKKPKPASQ